MAREIPKQVAWIYHTICDHSPDSVIVFDLRGTILHVNRTAERMLNHPGEALIGADFQKFLIGKREKSWFKGFLEGDPTNLSLSNIALKRGDGTVFHADVSFVNIREGEYRLGTVFVRDASLHHQLTLEKEKTEKLLSDVFRAIEDGISILDRDMTIVQTNSWMEKTHRDKMPLIGKKCYEAYQDRSSPCPNCPSVTSIKTGKSHYALVPQYIHGSQKGWLDLFTYPIKDSNGHVMGVVEYVRDVTQKVELEKKLAEKEKLFRQFFENAPIFSYITTKDGRFIDVNTSGAKLLGYTKEELLKKMVSDCYYYPEDRKLFAKTIEKEGYTKEYPLTLKNKAGNPVPCRVTATVLRSQQGNIIGYQGFIRDVTKEEHLKRKSNLFEMLLAKTDATVMITDSKGNIVFVNRPFEEITGYSFDEVIGKNPRILKSGFHDDAFYKELWETITSGRTWHGRFYNKRKNGTFYHEDAYIFPILDERENIISFAAIKRDVTHEVELESHAQQMAKLEAIGQLVGGIAHDFNNVLTSIQGFAELGLSKLSNNHSIYEELSSIRKAAEQATRITRQLLEFSRKQLISPRPYSLNRIINEMIPLLDRYIGEDIELAIRLTDEPDVIMADRGQIEQCILNLVVNARDAIRGVKESQQPRLITIETSRVTIDDTYMEKHMDISRGDYLLLSVSDTGVGMDKETLKKIFDPFFTTKPEGLGTGLGCATVFGIVKQNKGNVLAYSEPGDGTTIKIYWPASEKSLPDIKTKPAVPYHSPADTTDKTILIAEDNEGIRDFVTQALKTVGYRVYNAEDGQRALELVEKKNLKPDLLFTDAIMPRMNGKELAERLEQKFPGLKILFSSGYSEGQIFDKGFSKPNYAFVHKPYGLHKLLETVYMLLEEKE